MRALPLLAGLLALSACQTLPPERAPEPAPEVEAPPETATTASRQPGEAELPAPPAPIRAPDAPLRTLAGWTELDARPALAAFRRSCGVWARRDADAPVATSQPLYGTHADWRPACTAADAVGDTAAAARSFFEHHFAPAILSEGLLTGYYEPEVPASERRTALYSEPILAKPASDALRRRPRAEIVSTLDATNGMDVIAWARPADVFFMQVQGSGRLRFGDGSALRAAYGGHNGHPYSSIGKTLVEWGEMELHRVSKGNIEAWMEKAGEARARELMNTNERYIFFDPQSLPDGVGPDGAMRVPLTGMGSMAVDPRHHPYGTVAYLDTRLPRSGRDFKGRRAQLLLVGQDTGGAIKGEGRGDIFFGAGDAAGRLAGVMKHRGRWTVLLPKALARVEMAETATDRDLSP